MTIDLIDITWKWLFLQKWGYCTNTFNSSVMGHRPLHRNEMSQRSPVTTTIDKLGRAKSIQKKGNLDVFLAKFLPRSQKFSWPDKNNFLSGWSQVTPLMNWLWWYNRVKFFKNDHCLVHSHPNSEVHFKSIFEKLN